MNTIPSPACFRTRRLAQVRTAGAAVLIATTLISCGGGGAGSIADISGSGVVSGPVDGFGSIIANGVRMDISNATITDDGVTLTQADVDVGDTVTMRGTLNGDGTGTANTVVTDEFVKGPVEFVDPAGNRFVVMGQTVNVDLNTVFSGTTLASLQQGDLVGVHGALDSNDEVQATRVELKSSLNEFEVTGVIDTLADGSQSFTINDLTVSYAVANVSLQSAGSLAVGMYVDVASTTAPISGMLTASKVEQEDRIPGLRTGDEAEIEGPITGVLSSTRFVLNGVTVQYGPGTEFDSGSAAGIVVNANAEVEGRFDSLGVLQASKIEVKQAVDVRIASRVEAIDPSAGTLTVLGQVIATDSETQFEDERDGLQLFRLSNLGINDYVEVRAYQGTSGLIASRVERDDDSGRLELRGPVDSDNGTNQLVILGIPVTTDGSTQFEGQNGGGLSASAFYSAVMPGTVVEIRQDPYAPGNPIVADEADIKSSSP